MHDRRMATDEAEFWERRRSLTPSSTSAGDEEGGRRLGLFVDISDPAFGSAYRELRGELARFDCLAPTPPRSLHVTVKMLDRGIGYPRAPGDGHPAGGGELPPPVRRTLAAADPFELSFPRFNLFPDVVYAEVEDGGALPALNRALSGLEGTTELARDGDSYIPHLTLGYLTDEGDYPALVEYLETNRELELPSVEVEQLDLVVFDLGDGPHPDYETVETYDLETDLA